MTDGTVSAEQRDYLIDQVFEERRPAWRRLASGEKPRGHDAMTEIDELRGIGLAGAVAEAQGWTIDDDGIYIDADGQLTQYDAHEYSPDVYRPDEIIAQAWELDGEWWGWSFMEMGLGQYRLVIAQITLMVANDDGTHDRFEGQARFCDHDTKAAAYAAARCRAYLKARQSTATPEGIETARAAT